MFYFIDKTATKDWEDQLNIPILIKNIDGSYAVEHTVYNATVTSRNQTTANRSMELLKFVSAYRLYNCSCKQQYILFQSLTCFHRKCIKL